MGEGAIEDNEQKGEDSEALHTAALEGNEKLVQILLDRGADVNFQDGNHRDALQRASAEGHEKVVQILLDRGADINAREYRGNALKTAAAKGHEKVIQILLDRVTEIDTQESLDIALNAASERSHEKVMQILLDRGAKINAHNALNAASERAHKKSMQMLFDHQSFGRPLKVGVTVDYAMQILRGRETEVIVQARDSGNVLQAASAEGNKKRRLLGTEAEFNAQDGGYKKALQATSYAAPITVASTGSAEEGAGPTTLRAAIDRGYVGPVQEILDRTFDIVAVADFAWLWDLQELGYASEEIAELLVFERHHSPWICFEPYLAPEGTISLNFHHSSCVHREQAQNLIDPSEIRYSDDIKTVDPTRSKPSSSVEDDATSLIERLCGLAGILPTIRRDQFGRSASIDSRDPIITFGQVVFTTDKKFMIASVTYCPTERTFLARERQDEEILVLGLEISLDVSQRLNGLLKDLIAPLQKFCGAVAAAQKWGLCCDSFTVLSINGLAPSEPTLSQGSIKLCRIKVCHIVKLLTNLERILDEAVPTVERLPLVWEIINIAESLCRKFYSYYQPSDTQTEVYDMMLQSCSLAIQLLNLGFVLYVRAHIGPLHPCFLDRAIGTVHLYGVKNIETNAPEVSVKLQRFTCLNDMVEHPVLVFNTYQEGSGEPQSYDLLTTAEDLVDTWGPGSFVANDPDNARGSVTSIMIGGGSVKPVAGRSHVFHWSRDISPLHDSDIRIDTRTTICIGQPVLENEHCTLDPRNKMPSFRERLELLGTHSQHWSVTQVQVGLAVTAQQIVGGQIQFNKTWTWQEGTNWKKRFISSLDREIPYNALDQPWGLQVSFCTGVARRVPLRVLVADVLPAFAQELTITPTWAQLRDMSIVEALKGQQLRAWLENWESQYHDLKSTVERIIRHVLIDLQDTGVDRTNERLVISCRQVIASDTPMSMCIKVPCEKATLWAKVLADSVESATFAYMTSLCLVTQEHRCQMVNPWHCPSLKTAVCRHLDDRELSTSMNDQWNLRDQIAYWIGKPESGLLAKVGRICPGQDPRLLVSISRVSARNLSRLGSMSRMFKHHQKIRIREKLVENWPAEDVIILSEFSDRTG